MISQKDLPKSQIWFCGLSVRKGQQPKADTNSTSSRSATSPSWKEPRWRITQSILWAADLLFTGILGAAPPSSVGLLEGEGLGLQLVLEPQLIFIMTSLPAILVSQLLPAPAMILMVYLVVWPRWQPWETRALGHHALPGWACCTVYFFSKWSKYQEALEWVSWMTNVVLQPLWRGDDPRRLCIESSKWNPGNKYKTISWFQPQRTINLVSFPLFKLGLFKNSNWNGMNVCIKYMFVPVYISEAVGKYKGYHKNHPDYHHLERKCYFIDIFLCTLLIFLWFIFKWKVMLVYIFLLMWWYTVTTSQPLYLYTVFKEKQRN